MLFYLMLTNQNLYEMKACQFRLPSPFLFCFALSFFSFSDLSVVVVSLSLGLLLVQNFLRIHQ